MNQNEKFEQGRGGRGGRGGGQQSSIAAAFAKSQVDFPPHQKQFLASQDALEVIVSVTE